MSGSGDGRWRRSGNQQQQQQQPRHQQSQSTSRDRTHVQNRHSMSGNAWAQGDKPKGTTGSPQPGDQSAAPGLRTPGREEHVPVKGFNSADTKRFLKKCYQDTVKAAGDEKKLLWKASDGTSTPKPAWGTRADRMAGGRDFWALLRNQLSQVEQGKPAAS